MRKIHVLFHIDEYARDSIVASALKRVCQDKNIKIHFTNKKSAFILRKFNGFDAIILPSLQHFKYFFPFSKNLPKNVFILPSEAVGQATGTLRRMQAKYFGNNEIESKPWHQSVQGFLLWGESHKRGIVENINSYEKKCFVVGHPRLSIWCKSPKRSNNKNSIKTIGIVSRFGGINTFNQRGNMQYMINGMRLFENAPRWENSPEAMDAEDIIYTELIDFRLILTLIVKLGTNYKYKIRPHPREDRSQWQKLIKKNNLNIELSPWHHPFTTWLMEVDTIICPPSTSIYDMLCQDYHPICIDKIIKKRKNHVLTESDDNNKILEFICRPESLDELINIIKLNKVTKAKDGYEKILNTQIKSYMGNDSISNILKVLEENVSVKRGIKKYKSNISILFFQLFSFIFTHYSFIKNLYKKEQGSTISLTFFRHFWINTLSYKVTKGKRL